MTTDNKNVDVKLEPVAPWRRSVAAFLLGGRASLAVPLIVAALLITFPYWSDNAYWIYQIPLILVLALLVTGVNLSFGYAGELQLGQVFMFCIGAYLSMILAVRGVNNDIILGMLIGGAAAVIVGLVVALPAMRIGGWALAMASFFLVITIPDLISIFAKYTNGLTGLSGIPFPDIFGHTLGITGLYEVTIVTTIAWFVLYRNLVTSRYGIVFKSLRESPALTGSLGFSTLRLKTTIYGLGAFPAGIAGCLYGYLTFILEPGSFGFQLGIGTVAACLLGGSESVYGVLIGAAILQLGPERSVAFANWAPVAYGGFLIIAAVLLRGGISRYGKLACYHLAKRIDPEIKQSRIAARSALLESDDETVDGAIVEGNADVANTSSLQDIHGMKLDIENVTMTFGGVKALRDVSLVANPGEVTALIGSNGSGKTTLLNVICGYVTPQDGKVKLDGKNILGSRTNQISRLGIGRTFQTPTIPKGVTVRDVVATGRFAKNHIGFLPSMLRLPRYWRAQHADRREAMALLEVVGLAHVAGEEASSRPLGDRRLIEVARVLCSEPGVVLLDEPASGLNDQEAERLAKLITKVARAGATIILIEHNFRFIRKVADTVHVLHFGKLIANGTADDVAAEPQVIESYLGSAVIAAAPTRERSELATLDGSPLEPRLVVDSLESGYGDLCILKGVSMSIMPASIEVVLGRNGVGKTTLLSNFAGLLRPWKGSMTLDGAEVRRTPYRRAASGVVLVQEGKRIFRQRTVYQNVLLGTYSLKLKSAERDELCHKVLEGFPMLQERLQETAGGLSGGQQQMLAIAQAIASRPKVLLLDEPSAGLAPTIVDELFARLRVFADEGLAIVLVEQLADKALAIADHVTLLDDGLVVASGNPEEFSENQKLRSAYFGM
jgi:branched-chain amino acid transport system permease protein